MSDLRAGRFARNEAHCRSLNEQLGPAQQARGGDRLLAILCECSNPDCDRVVRVHAEKYEEVRSNAERFLVAPGHELPDIEVVVEQGEGYILVEKIGPGRAIARETDPNDS